LSLFIVGICGGSASGKTTLAKKLSKLFDCEVGILSLDNYYKNFSGMVEELSKVNYDHPDSLDITFFIEHIEALKEGRKIEVPVYDYENHGRKKETKSLQVNKLLIIEGLFLYNIGIPDELFDLKVFMDTPSDIRFIRRLVRDREERGRTVESIVNQYLATVRPMHDIYVAPNKKLADVVFKGAGYSHADLTKLADRIKSTGTLTC
jgi:uridine kinase